MNANFNPIASLRRSLVQALRRVLIRRHMLPILTVFAGALAGQAAEAQETVYIGGQGTPGVTINLDAIYDGPGRSSVAPIPSLQPELAEHLGDRRLRIPNLHLAPATRQITLRPPSSAAMQPVAPRPAPAKAKRAQAAATAPAATAPAAKMPAVTVPKVTRSTLARPTVPPAPPAPNDLAVAKQAPAQLSRLSPPPPPPQAMVTKTPPPPPAMPAPVEAPKAMAPEAPAPKTVAPKTVAPNIAAPKAPAAKMELPKAPRPETVTRMKPTAKISAPLPPPPPPLPVAPKMDKGTGVKEAGRETAEAPAMRRPEAPAAKDQQRLASLAPTDDDLVQIRFRPGSSVLSEEDENRLKAMVAKVVPTESRLQLKAYAEGRGNDTSKARRLSLSRALAVRSFLIENGLRSTRIDVRALGIARDGGAPDRVDIIRLEH